MTRPGRLLLATANPGKVVELRELLAGTGIEVALPSEAGLAWESPPEDGADYRANARIKAEDLVTRSGQAALGDDSGLEVEALGGRPGVHSARYGPDAAARNARLLAELAGLPPARRGARFVCVLALAVPGRDTRFFEGILPGRIGLAPRGTGGFGYDPLFELAGDGRTLAELARSEKGSLSHRGRALAGLVAFLAGPVVT